jgi:hypothetical protein
MSERTAGTPWTDAKEAAEERLVPGFTTKEGVLRGIREGLIPPGVVARVGHRVFLHRQRLAEWLAAGGSLGSGDGRSRP